MKTAIYIEDGTIQLVLTPETKFEKSVISLMDGDIDAKRFTGSFYDCRGGWVRQSAYQDRAGFTYNTRGDDDSLILRVNKQEMEIK